MVTKERKRVDIATVKSLLEKYNFDSREVVAALRKLPVRQSSPPPPDGGISISGASRTFGIPHPTISRWASKGLIAIILRTRKEVYISYEDAARVVADYKLNPGRGKRTAIAPDHEVRHGN